MKDKFVKFYLYWLVICVINFVCGALIILTILSDCLFIYLTDITHVTMNTNKSELYSII